VITGLIASVEAEQLLGTPIATRTLLRRAAQADIIPTVLDAGGAVLDVGRTRRIATLDQTRGLIARDKCRRLSMHSWPARCACQTGTMLCTIVGAGPGLGVALAERFSNGDYDVALLCRSPGRLAGWHSEQPDPDRVATFAADAANPADLAQAFEQTRSWRGDTDVLIYNVADLTPDAVEELGTEQLLTSMRTNVGGLLDSLDHVLPHMRHRGQGTILITGGGLALEPYPDWAGLAAGKAALRSIAINLHKRLLPEGIHVAIIAVCGIICAGGPFDPQLIADKYWEIHQQELTSATRELVYLPAGEDPYYNDPDRTYQSTSEPIKPTSDIR
jgi:NADP-dependent 3-hydroxy acid dehydrogenase YdfG